MSKGDLEYRLYRCKTGKTIGSKDWAIAITAERHLAIRHCATGQTARLLDIPPSSFETASAEDEMLLRENKQISQGYTFVGRAIVRKGHLESLAPTPSRGTPSFHWEIRVPIPRELLLGELQSLTAQLQTGPLPDPIVFDPELGVCVMLSETAWEFGYSDTGGVGADHRGGGVIQAEQGLLPLLLVLALQRSFPDHVGIADAMGNPFGCAFTAEDSILVTDRFDHRLVVELIGRLGWYSSWIPLPESPETAAALWV